MYGWCGEATACVYCAWTVYNVKRWVATACRLAGVGSSVPELSSSRSRLKIAMRWE